MAAKFPMYDVIVEIKDDHGNLIERHGYNGFNIKQAKEIYTSLRDKLTEAYVNAEKERVKSK